MPEPEPGGIVVRVRVALTDGTDLKAYRRGHPMMPMPTRFGHEFSGDVAALGGGVRNFAVGDAIATVHTAPCRVCFWCQHGEEELCEWIMGTMVLGGYAEFVAIPAAVVAQNAYRKPPEMPYERAAFLEPLSCVVHALDRLAPRRGATVAVIGDGAFGLLHVAVAALRYECTVILCGHHAEHLALGTRFGAAHIIDTRDLTDQQLREHILAITAGRGADAVIECTGAASVWEMAPSLVRRGGTVLPFGGLPDGTRVAFDAGRLHYDEVRIVSPFHLTPRAVRAAFELLASSTIDVTALISARYPLARIAEAFHDLEARRGLKFAIVP